MKFLDLSNNNDVRSFKAIKQAGFDGVMLKVSEGATFVDPDFKNWAARARYWGLRVGGYHFAYPSGGDAVAEAEHFVRNLGEIKRRDYRPVLDLEINPGRLSGGALTAWARAWTQKVAELSGTLPLFYSYPYFIKGMHADSPIGAGLWLASYGPNDGKEHPYVVPAPWQKAVAHQYTSNGEVPGVRGRVDVNRIIHKRPMLAHPILGWV